MDTQQRPHTLITSRWVWVVALFTFGLLVDQWTKSWARTELSDGPILLGSTEIGFSLHYNPGSAFSLFQSGTAFITALATCVFVFVCVMIFRTDNTWTALGFTLIATGAAGNLLDRYLQPPGVGQGHVTDFIKVYSFPTFNIADSLVTVGVGLLLFVTLFVTKKVV